MGTNIAIISFYNKEKTMPEILKERSELDPQFQWDRTPMFESDAAWETSDPFVTLAKAQDRRFERSIEDNLSLFGDRALVQQMISILLDNAFKYSDPCGSISLSIYRQRKSCVIEAYNTCEPGALTDIDRFFDRFYRADKARSGSGGGTGVGLSIARAAAEAHGGSISAQSVDNRIVFSVTLPLGDVIKS